MIGAGPANRRVVEHDRLVTVARAAAPAAGPPPVSSGLSGRRAPVDWLFAPVDAASLTVFRIAFGALLLWEVWKYAANGWIARYYVDPTFHFTYYGFEWVRPWPGVWMYLHFAILGLLAACIAVGAGYRVAAALFCLGFTYVFLLEQARYLNHLYLVCLFGFLLSVVPAHRAFSVDAWLGRAGGPARVPAWALWIVRFQVAVPYVYGGLAKLNGDWLAGEPIRSWLAERGAQSVLGPWLNQEWLVFTICYGGLLFDLAIVPLLLWRRTRVLALVAALAFHLANAYLFTIGIFPWLMIAATLLFLPPDWPRRVTSPPNRCAARTSAAPTSLSGAERGSSSRVVLAFLGVYVAVQLLVPLRHHLYPGDVAWTEEGHRFSWRMRLRDKEQSIELLVRSPSTGLERRLDPRQFVTAWQYEGMAGRPDMVLQLAHHVAERARQQGHPDVEVRVRALTSLNGRPGWDQIDPTVDLAQEPRTVLPAAWIVPLDERAVD